ncbi:hypothetical protein BKA67DRAFT_529108 [Truncatella angustata]|uniref:Uncharacterized protein n=1 Tax=Truncatella angustata TaxID=152316 RepID=A0A9P8UV49_9PEZI|nr:uncharacterized protein BKA67DRAFT_529108 [Truncatella angustata]KAH6658917.1 hypothetical protein BKA67DRAFT_529108 [Truncatella angustata]
MDAKSPSKRQRAEADVGLPTYAHQITKPTRPVSPQGRTIRHSGYMSSPVDTGFSKPSIYHTSANNAIGCDTDSDTTKTGIGTDMDEHGNVECASHNNHELEMDVKLEKPQPRCEMAAQTAKPASPVLEPVQEPVQRESLMGRTLIRGGSGDFAWQKK